MHLYIDIYMYVNVFKKSVNSGLKTKNFHVNFDYNQIVKCIILIVKN